MEEFAEEQAPGLGVAAYLDIRDKLVYAEGETDLRRRTDYLGRRKTQFIFCIHLFVSLQIETCGYLSSQKKISLYMSETSISKTICRHKLIYIFTYFYLVLIFDIIHVYIYIYVCR